MKAYHSYVWQKNSKRGIALSTAMAICIILALLTAILVSMATLNITTTQTTISRREAYIQAKSAIAFAESYYTKNPGEIPGNADGETGGEALFVFKDDVIAHGANVYITGTSASPTLINPATVQNLKDTAPDTYVEVKNTGAVVDLSAYCKYDIDTQKSSFDAYKLSKEFEYDPSHQAKPNTFTGNILYNAKSDSKYLRIHVRTSAAFNKEPRVYTWANEVEQSIPSNPADESKSYPFGGSASVNKLSYDGSFGTEEFSGTWAGQAMEYEGDGWYVSEVNFTTGKKYNYINAIITRPDAKRTEGSGLDTATSQSWELFDIPVPNENGMGNGTDVYITLNQPMLRDARLKQSSSIGFYEWKDGHGDYQSSAAQDGTGHDEMTYLYERAGSIDNFAQFCSEWYTVYIKQTSAIMHYKRAGVTDNSAKPGDFTYEGYGWSRKVTHNFSDSFTAASGNTYWFGSSAAHNISYNSYGDVMVKELFVVEGQREDGTFASAEFGDENLANKWLVDEFGDTTAPDYITINVKANEMPVKEAVTTTIDYSASIIEGGDDPTPGSGGDSDTEEPPAEPEANTNEELKFQNLAQSTTAQSGANTAGIANWGVAGNFPGNAWAGADDTGKFYYDRMQKTVNTSGYIHEYTYENLPAGDYQYKFVSMYADSGEFDPSSVTWVGEPGAPNPDGNAMVTVPEGYKLTVRFDRQSGTVLTPVLTNGTGEEIVTPSGNGYRVFCNQNNWGRDEGASGDHYYSKAYPMERSADNNVFYYDIVLKGGQVERLKVLKEVSGETAEANSNEGWSNSWPNQDYNINIPGTNMDTYSVRVYFRESSHEVWNDDPVPISSVSTDKFYVIGDMNEWGKKFGTEHTYEAATYGDKYYMGDTPKIDGGYAEYTADIGMTYSGTYALKVIATDGTKTGPIDYERSWGAKNASGVSSGADKQNFSFTVNEACYVTIIFRYNLSDPTKSEILYQTTKISDDTGLTTYDIGFLNKQLENVNEPHDKTDFTTPWTKAFVTYTTPRGLQKDVPIDFGTASEGVIWTKVPSDAYDIYFSNMEYEHKGETGYEYTDKIPNSRINGNYPIFVPTTSEEDEKHNMKWNFGDADFYRSHVNSVTDVHETGVQMQYVGSFQDNYYNVPLVNLLKEILKREKGISGGQYVFAAYPYNKNKDGFEMKVSGQTLYMKRNQYITYQGEYYFYDNSTTGFSYLVCQGKNRSGGGYLLENEFAMESGAWDKDPKHMRMDNRQGAVFTSSGQYYDGSYGPHGYDGYSPNWYTIKLPVTDEFTIENIRGVVRNDYPVISGNSTKTQVAKAGEYLNRPVYIYFDKDYTGKESVKVYTYDTNFGGVDTNEDGKVSVYFNKPSDWSSKVKIHAYGIIGGADDREISVDGTDSTPDHGYYRYEFDAGKYCFFRFYDAEDPGKTTEVLTFTGEENENREYRTLCDAANGNMSEFVYYLHPKTRALYAWQEARGAKTATDIPQGYEYKNNMYSPLPNSSHPLNYLSGLESQAKTLYQNGPWSDGSAASYADKAAAAKTFAAAIKKARIYIAAEKDTTDDYEKHYIFPERDARDDILKYDERWVSALRYTHDQAMQLYNRGSSEDITGALYAYAAEIETIIQNPETTLNPEAVQIVVDNQAVYTDLKEDPSDPNKVTGQRKDGDWDVSLIRLYTENAAGTIEECTLKLFETTQSSEGFYAYVFMADKFRGTETDPLKFMVGRVTDVPTSTSTLQPGTTYIFHTATKEFEEDKGTHTITCVYSELVKGGQGDAYGKYTSKKVNEKINIMFRYDTTVKYDGKQYKIMAGNYTISGSYPGFKSDFSGGVTGINLFTDTARTYFTNPKICGLTASSTVPNYSNYSSSQSGGGEDIDIVADGLSSSGELKFETNASTGRVNFRWNNSKSATGSNSEALTLPCKVTLIGGVATVAVNNLDLNGKEFHMEAKKVTFYCDTKIKTSAGTFTITHGTYLFNNNSGSSTLVPIDLSTTGTANDWRRNYILVEEVKTDLGGGKFVAK